MKTVMPGIRRKENGRFVATKSLDGKRFYKEFKTLREAQKWKERFHPLVSSGPTISESLPLSSANENGNGRDRNITVGAVFESYLSGPVRNFSTYSRYKIPKRMERFLRPILSLRLCQLTPDAIDHLLKFSEVEATRTHGRQSFKEELKYLRAMLNWYKGEKDFYFICPVMSRHMKQKVFHVEEKARKAVSLEEAIRFIGCLDDKYKDLATIQLKYALRIGEVCALGRDSISHERNTLRISRAIIWPKDKAEVKLSTKTSDTREVILGEESKEIFERLEKNLPKGVKYFFHSNGELPKYRPIVNAFNEALDKAGIHDIRGTHFLRHTMATMARKYGGIEAAQAMLGHKSPTMSQLYAKIDSREKASEVVIHAEALFAQARATIATNDENLSLLSNNT